MRVLATSWAVSDWRGGGEPIAAYDLVKHLAALGVEVDVVTPDYDAKLPLGAPARVFPVAGGPRPGNTGANKAAMLRETRRLRAAGRYDVEHVLSQFTSFPIEGRPFVMSGCWVFPSEERAPSALARLARDVRRGPVGDVARDVAFALREERARGWTRARTIADADLVIVRQKLGVEEIAPVARRVEHVPFGIDVEDYPFSDAGRDPVVLFAGNLKPYKNVDGLLRAFAEVVVRVPRARLRIAGAGPEEAPLRALASALGVATSVDFLGHVPRPALREAMRTAAVLALPSRGESFGLVALEAMASGTPVVVSDRISGAFDYLEPGVNGHFASPAEPSTVARGLLAVLEDPAAARRMGAAARRTAERFSWRDVARRHVELYRSLA